MRNIHRKLVVVWISFACVMFLFIGSALGQTAFIKITATPERIDANGESASKIEAVLTDSSGDPVAANTKATFTTTHGFFVNGEQTITESTTGIWDEEEGAWTALTGTIYVSLISDTVPGIAIVTCTVTYVRLGQRWTVKNSTKVTIGDVADNEKEYRADLFAYPTRIPPDGASFGNILAIVTENLPEGRGMAARAGTVVEFKTDRGLFSNGEDKITTYLSDSSGLVAVRLYSDTTPGIARVECRVAGNLYLHVIDVIMQYPQPDVLIRFEQEPNNRPEDANPASTRTIYKGSLHNPYDEDFFAFTLNEPQTVDIYFLATNSNCALLECGSFNIDVRNGDNQVMAHYMHFVTVDPLAVQQWEVYLTAGTYYVVVYKPPITRYTSSPYFLYLDY